jgi:hypothetical protein
LILGGKTMISSINVSDADAKFTGEAIGDYAGYSVAGAGDVNDDGYADILIGAPYEGIEGSTYLVLGGCDGATACGGSETGLFKKLLRKEMSLSDADAQFIGEKRDDHSGRSVSGAGDLNNDGYDDIVVGSWGYDSSSSGGEGAAYVLLGGSNGRTPSGFFSELSTPVSGPDWMSVSKAAAKLVGEAVGDRAGMLVSGAGDVNKDGYADLLVGSQLDDDGDTDAGAVYLLLGGCDNSVACGSSLTGFWKGLTVSGTATLKIANVKMTGEATNDLIDIEATSAGDVNGDGYGDIVIGASREDSVATDAGVSYLLLGGCDGSAGCGGLTTGLFLTATSGVMSLGDANVIFTGDSTSQMSGRSIAGIGDTNDDGYGDLLIGASQLKGGSAYFLYGGNDGSGSGSTASGLFAKVGSSGTVPLKNSDFIYMGESTGDGAGWSVSATGDLNGDGYFDFLIGAPLDDDTGTDAGAVYVMYGQ